MHELNAILTIAFRDVTKLLRDKTRILANFIFPIIFIGVLGTSLQANLSNDIGYNFLAFVFIGVIAQTLFQSTASGIVSLVDDRQTDFAQEMFIAPISRYSILIGKIIGETLVSLIQMVGVLIFGVVFAIPLDYLALLQLLPFAFLVAFFGGAFGILVMANLNDQRSANQIFPFLLFPQFFLAGVFNPIKELPLVLLILSRISPMTYAVDMMRSVYYWGKPEYAEVVLFNPALNMLVITVVTVLCMIVGTYLFVKNERSK